MLIISHQNHLFKMTSGDRVLGQARTLARLLQEVDGQKHSEATYIRCARILEPLIQRSGGQIATGGLAG